LRNAVTVFDLTSIIGTDTPRCFTYAAYLRQVGKKLFILPVIKFGYKKSVNFILNFFATFFKKGFL